MNQKNEQKLNQLIRQRLDNLDHTKLEKSTMDEEEYNRTMRELDKFSSIVLNSEQYHQKMNSDSERATLEKEKFEFDKELKREELKIRVKECDIKLAELKQNKTKIILSFSIDCLVKTIAAGLGIRAQLWDYKGYKIESSWSKESRNNLMK